MLIISWKAHSDKLTPHHNFDYINQLEVNTNPLNLAPHTLSTGISLSQCDHQLNCTTGILLRVTLKSAILF